MAVPGKRIHARRRKVSSRSAEIHLHSVRRLPCRNLYTIQDLAQKSCITVACMAYRPVKTGSSGLNALDPQTHQLIDRNMYLVSF